MSGINGLLVDMDGTLVDTAEANFLAYAEALAAVGVSVSRQAFDEVAFGRNWAQFLPTLLEGREDADPAAVAAHKARIYPAQIRHTTLNDALVALITSVRRTAARRSSRRPHRQTSLP
jgi:beta-phosphoglucomutase